MVFKQYSFCDFLAIDSLFCLCLFFLRVWRICCYAIPIGFFLRKKKVAFWDRIPGQVDRLVVLSTFCKVKETEKELTEAVRKAREQHGKDWVV